MLSPEMHFAVGLMDANYPGWRAKVDVDTLDLGGLDTCIIGQVVPRKRDQERAEGMGRWTSVMATFAGQLGQEKFNVMVADCFAHNARYRPEWVEAIQAAR